MSAAVGGKCRKCGHEFGLSFGHPKWFEEYRKNNVRGPEADALHRLQTDKTCPACAPDEWEKQLGIILGVKDV